MKLKLFSAALLSGLLLALAWLGMSGIILLVAFIPLLWVENYFIRNKERNTSLVFWSYSLITFFLWNILDTWWIWNATPAGAIFAIVTNSFLMSFVWWLVHVIRRRKGSGFANVFLVFAWISFEFLHFHWDLAWPWLTLGNGFANDIMMIQWYEYTGVFGGTFWVLVSNIVFWSLIKKFYIENISIHPIQIVVALLVVIFPLTVSFILFKTYQEKDSGVSVVVAQPNIDPYHDKFSQMSHQEQYGRLFNMCDSLGNDSIDFFIGPETALHEVWLNNWKFNLPVQLVQNFIANKYPNAAFVVGAMSYHEYLNKDDATTTARYNSDSTLIYDAFNSAVLVTQSGVEAIYHKSKLVAGVEQMPFNKYLRRLDRLVINLGGTTGTLATFNQPEVFHHNGICVGVPICYESVFGQYVSGFIKKGAELLFVITNDGWWKNTPGYRQHLSYSRILAIEFRRSIARSGNTGISCLINQKGELLQTSQWWTQTALKGELNRNSKVTFYANSGDYMARISVFMMLLMVLLFISERIYK